MYCQLHSFSDLFWFWVSTYSSLSSMLAFPGSTLAFHAAHCALDGIQHPYQMVTSKCLSSAQGQGYNCQSPGLRGVHLSTLQRPNRTHLLLLTPNFSVCFSTSYNATVLTPVQFIPQTFLKQISINVLLFYLEFFASSLTVQTFMAKSNTQRRVPHDAYTGSHQPFFSPSCALFKANIPVFPSER